MEPLFLILGCLIVGYPAVAARVVACYLALLLLRSEIRRWTRR
ncbi:hypothetical protein [Tautonia sociabilis]|nr:hypothetical protein [Tautonia sociabilis]